MSLYCLGWFLSISIELSCGFADVHTLIMRIRDDCRLVLLYGLDSIFRIVICEHVVYFIELSAMVMLLFIFYSLENEAFLEDLIGLLKFSHSKCLPN